MPALDWHRVRNVFEAALDRPAAQRAGFVGEQGLDEPAAAEVRALLEANDVVARFTHLPVSLHFDRLGPELDGRLEGRRLGAYTLVREIGRGGSSTVFLAARADADFERLVAVKVLHGSASAPMMERFASERQILAGLEHPNIARLYDWGTAPDGRSYVVMEHVDGEPLVDYCDARSLGVEERLSIFRRVCAAVAYAHQRLVVHRDLKPTNILVTADGQPRLLDFGIAKILAQGPSAATLAEPGGRLLTPAYAAPEQLTGGAITMATDTYALGVVLYELLAGTLPHPDQLAERLHALLADVQPPPASAACSVGAPGGARRRQLRGRLRGDLDAIVSKSLRNEPETRYATVDELGADLDRMAASRPVLARKRSIAYRCGRFVRRNRTALAMGALVVAGAIGFGWALFSAATEARRQRDRAQRTTEFVTDLFWLSSPDREVGESATARQLLEAGARRIGAEFSGQPELHAQMLDTMATVYGRFGMLIEARRLFEEAQQLRSEHSMPDAERVTGLLGLVSVLHQLGDLDNARQTLAHADEIIEGLGRRGTEQRIPALLLHGHLLRTEGSLEEAHAMAERALSLSESHYGTDHRTTAECLLLLAGIERRLGDLEGAGARLESALATTRAAVGPSHPDMAPILDEMGAVAHLQGDNARALELVREALRIRESFLVAPHPGLAATWSRIAGIEADLGHVEQAEAAYRRSLEMERRLYPEGHYNTAATLNNLGVLLFHQERSAEAMPLLVESLEMTRAMLGERHPQYVAALFSLASLLHHGGRLDEAARYYERCLAGAGVLDGRPQAGYPRAGYAALLVDLGDLERAEELARQAVDLVTASHPPTHWRRYWALSILAAVLQAEGRVEEAQPLAKEALAGLEHELGGDERRVREARDRLLRAGATL